VLPNGAELLVNHIQLKLHLCFFNGSVIGFEDQVPTAILLNPDRRCNVSLPLLIVLKFIKKFLPELPLNSDYSVDVVPKFDLR